MFRSEISDLSASAPTNVECPGEETSGGCFIPLVHYSCQPQIIYPAHPFQLIVFSLLFPLHVFRKQYLFLDPRASQ